MSTDTQQDEAGNVAPEEAEAVDSAEANETPEKTPEQAAEPSLEEQLKQLTEEKLRVAADFANYQKRVNRDRAKWTQDAVRDAIASLLPVLDNLDHAIAAFEGDVKEPAVYRQGVELVEQELLRVLGHYQLERIDPEAGEAFDPDQHQAISIVPGDVESDAVAAVARAGYRLGETVLRPAQVVVQKPQ